MCLYNTSQHSMVCFEPWGTNTVSSAHGDSDTLPFQDFGIESNHMEKQDFGIHSLCSAPLPHFPSFQVAHLTYVWQWLGETYRINRQNYTNEARVWSEGIWFVSFIKKNLWKILSQYGYKPEGLNTLWKATLVLYECVQKLWGEASCGCCNATGHLWGRLGPKKVFTFILWLTQKSEIALYIKRGAVPAYPHLAALMFPLPREVKWA